MGKGKKGVELRQAPGPEGPIFYELTRKAVKNLNLRVREDGSVSVSAPPRASLAQIQRFVDRKSACRERVSLCV